MKRDSQAHGRCGFFFDNFHGRCSSYRDFSVENALPLDIPTPLCGPAHGLAGAPISSPRHSGLLHRRVTLRQLAPSIPRTPYTQQLVRLLPIEENLRTLHDGGEGGVGLMIRCPVLFGVHKLNANRGSARTWEGAFAQVYVIQPVYKVHKYQKPSVPSVPRETGNIPISRPSWA